MRVSTGLGLLATLAVLSGAPACEEPPADTIPVGLLLSFTGPLAANSINSERAVLMAVEGANAAGGIAGRKLRVRSRDTRSDATRVGESANELIALGAQVLIGPDNRDLATALKGVIGEQATLIMPSFATASNFSKPHTWFSMGAPALDIACELWTQLQMIGAKNPILIVDSIGYSSLLGWELNNHYGVRRFVLPAHGTSDAANVQPIVAARADGYVLVAMPPSASSLLQAMAAVGAFPDAKQWLFGPTLHTPALLELVPGGALVGARGVSSGTVDATTAEAFGAAFRQRWGDYPLDDAYPFYDASTVGVLALQRGFVKQGALPDNPGLAEHIRAVTGAGGTVVAWNEIGRGLALLGAGEEIEYVGLTGRIQFDLAGQSPFSSTTWWTIGAQGFENLPNSGGCR